MSDETARDAERGRNAIRAVFEELAKRGLSEVKQHRLAMEALAAPIATLLREVSGLKQQMAVPALDEERDAPGLAYRWVEFRIAAGAEPKASLEFPYWLGVPDGNGYETRTAAIPPDVRQTVRDAFDNAEVLKEWTAPLEWAAAPSWWPEVRRLQLGALMERRIMASLRLPTEGAPR